MDPTVNQRIEFPKGGRRDDGARVVAFHLICPEAIRHYALTAKEGEIKYGKNNWTKGIPTDNYIDHALEHIINTLQEPETGNRILHLSHALWNIAAAIHNETGCRHHVWED